MVPPLRRPFASSARLPAFAQASFPRLSGASLAVERYFDDLAIAFATLQEGLQRSGFAPVDFSRPSEQSSVFPRDRGFLWSSRLRVQTR